MATDATVGLKTGAVGGTSMRYHELALRLWLYQTFFVREGYPVPVVFTSPMDAFASFSRLWAEDKNPFQYLLELKDEHGTPLYEPHPAPVRYPLISVHRKGFRYRQYQNFSIHNWQHVNWPTVSDEVGVVSGKEQQGTDLTRCDLGNVTVSRRPQAWDYRFQVDHWCMRPDTQAFFVERLIKQMWRTGGTPQTWIVVSYPGYGDMLVRMFIEGDIENATPEEPEEGKNVEFRTTFTLVLEGFSMDIDFKIVPALWTLITGANVPDPVTLENAFVIVSETNLRLRGKNPTLAKREHVPAVGDECKTLSTFGVVSTQVIYLGNPAIPQTPADNEEVPGEAGYPGGTPAPGLFGVPTVSHVP